MLFDFGLDEDLFENETAIDIKIKQIETKFDLIMIAEMFDESMVLLANLLCWDLQDVTYLKTNSRENGGKTKLSEEAMEELQKWVEADQKLYRHFISR